MAGAKETLIVKRKYTLSFTLFFTLLANVKGILKWGRWGRLYVGILDSINAPLIA